MDTTKAIKNVKDMTDAGVENYLLEYAGENKSDGDGDNNTSYRGNVTQETGRTDRIVLSRDAVNRLAKSGYQYRNNFKMFK